MTNSLPTIYLPIIYFCLSICLYLRTYLLVFNINDNVQKSPGFRAGFPTLPSYGFHSSFAF